MLQLPSPTVVGQVTIDTISTGTKVEIRSASTPSPAKLDDTTVLAPAFALKPGHNVIPVKAGSPDVESAGVDLDAGDHRRQEPCRYLRDHGPSGLVNPGNPGKSAPAGTHSAPCG